MGPINFVNKPDDWCENEEQIRPPKLTERYSSLHLVPRNIIVFLSASTADYTANSIASTAHSVLLLVCCELEEVSGPQTLELVSNKRKTDAS